MSAISNRSFVLSKLLERYQIMKLTRAVPTALIVLLSVMQVSQLQAASTYKVGIYDDVWIKNKHQKPTLKTCKRAVYGSGQFATRQKSLSIAKRRWSRNAKDIYGSVTSWSSAKNKRQTCSFDSSTGHYNCKVRAHPCYSGVYQNSK